MLHGKADCASYLLPGNAHVVAHISKDSGLNVVALVAHSPTTSDQLGTLLLARVNQRQNLLELNIIHLTTKQDSLMFISVRSINFFLFFFLSFFFLKGRAR